MFEAELDSKQIQQALPDYKYIKRLGSGAFATVHLVQRKTNGQQLALKKVNCFGMGEYQKAGAANQVRILSSLDHRNLIKVYSCLFDNSQDALYIFMEYADSGDLTTLIQQAKQKKKRIPQSTIWKAIYDISDALQFLHLNQIIHRDLKPANIFREGKNFKVGDLNVSKVLKKGQVASTKTGSPFYTAPEVWQQQQYDNKCDIWSLGVLIYQLCSLSVPYQIQSVFQIANKIRSQKQKSLPIFYSTSLNQLVKRMMDLNPKNRPTAEQIVKISKQKLQIETQGLDQKAVDNLMKTIVFPDTHQRWVNLVPKALPPKTNRKQNISSSQVQERQKSKSRQKSRQRSRKNIEGSNISQNNSGIFRTNQRKPIQLPRNKSKSRLQRSVDQKSDILPPICKNSPQPTRKQSKQKQTKQISKQKRDASNSSKTGRKTIIETVNQAKSIINVTELSSLQ